MPASHPVCSGGSESTCLRSTSTKSISVIRSSTASPPGRRAFASFTTARRKVVTQDSAPSVLPGTRSTRGSEARSGLKGRASRPRNPQASVAQPGPVPRRLGWLYATFAPFM